MVFFRSCPRCSGDRILERDVYGWYMLCLACGYMTYPQVKPTADAALREAQRTASAAAQRSA